MNRVSILAEIIVIKQKIVIKNNFWWWINMTKSTLLPPFPCCGKHWRVATSCHDGWMFLDNMYRERVSLQCGLVCVVLSHHDEQTSSDNTDIDESSHQSEQEHVVAGCQYDWKSWNRCCIDEVSLLCVWACACGGDLVAWKYAHRCCTWMVFLLYVSRDVAVRHYDHETSWNKSYTDRECELQISSCSFVLALAV